MWIISLSVLAVSLICSPCPIDSASAASYIRLLARSCVTQLGQKITLKNLCMRQLNFLLGFPIREIRCCVSCGSCSDYYNSRLADMVQQLGPAILGK